MDLEATTSREAKSSGRSHISELQVAIDAIPVQVWCALPNGSVYLQNRAALEYFGLPPQEMDDRSWEDGIHPDDLAGCLSAFARTRDTQVVGEAEARLRRFDGAYRWFLIRVVPIESEAGAIVRCYGTNTDIDDRKRVQQYLAARAVQAEVVPMDNVLPSMLDVFDRL